MNETNEGTTPLILDVLCNHIGPNELEQLLSVFKTAVDSATELRNYEMERQRTQSHTWASSAERIPILSEDISLLHANYNYIKSRQKPQQLSMGDKDQETVTQETGSTSSDSLAVKAAAVFLQLPPGTRKQLIDAIRDTIQEKEDELRKPIDSLKVAQVIVEQKHRDKLRELVDSLRSTVNELENIALVDNPVLPEMSHSTGPRDGRYGTKRPLEDEPQESNKQQKVSSSSSPSSQAARAMSRLPDDILQMIVDFGGPSLIGNVATSLGVDSSSNPQVPSVLRGLDEVAGQEIPHHIKRGIKLIDELLCIGPTETAVGTLHDTVLQCALAVSVVMRGAEIIERDFNNFHLKYNVGDLINPYAVRGIIKKRLGLFETTPSIPNAPPNNLLPRMIAKFYRIVSVRSLICRHSMVDDITPELRNSVMDNYLKVFQFFRLIIFGGAFEKFRADIENNSEPKDEIGEGCFWKWLNSDEDVTDGDVEDIIMLHKVDPRAGVNGLLREVHDFRFKMSPFRSICGFFQLGAPIADILHRKYSDQKVKIKASVESLIGEENLAKLIKFALSAETSNSWMDDIEARIRSICEPVAIESTSHARPKLRLLMMYHSFVTILVLMSSTCKPVDKLTHIILADSTPQSSRVNHLDMILRMSDQEEMLTHGLAAFMWYIIDRPSALATQERRREEVTVQNFPQYKTALYKRLQVFDPSSVRKLIFSFEINNMFSNDQGNAARRAVCYMKSSDGVFLFHNTMVHEPVRFLSALFIFYDAVALLRSYFLYECNTNNTPRQISIDVAKLQPFTWLDLAVRGKLWHQQSQFYADGKNVFHPCLVLLNPRKGDNNSDPLYFLTLLIKLSESLVSRKKQTSPHPTNGKPQLTYAIDIKSYNLMHSFVKMNETFVDFVFNRSAAIISSVSFAQMQMAEFRISSPFRETYYRVFFALYIFMLDAVQFTPKLSNLQHFNGYDKTDIKVYYSWIVSNAGRDEHWVFDKKASLQTLTAQLRSMHIHPMCLHAATNFGYVSPGVSSVVGYWFDQAMLQVDLRWFPMKAVATWLDILFRKRVPYDALTVLTEKKIQEIGATLASENYGTAEAIVISMRKYLHDMKNEFLPNLKIPKPRCDFEFNIDDWQSETWWADTILESEDSKTFEKMLESVVGLVCMIDYFAHRAPVSFAEEALDLDQRPFNPRGIKFSFVDTDPETFEYEGGVGDYF